MFDKILRPLETLFDLLEKAWEEKAMQRLVGAILIGVFLASIGAIELSRRGWLPESLLSLVPKNHFYAVNVAFTMLLVVEVLGLVFAFARSVSEALGKQFEIFSLILLRQSFKEFVHFNEPLQWQELSEPVWLILSDMGGALLIFGLLTLYYHLQKHRPFISDEAARRQFCRTKKTVALSLLLIFLFIGMADVLQWMRGAVTYDFFSTFYTVLVFCDVLVVLISLIFSSTYPILFRNSGYAVATIVIRLALTAPPFIDVGLGLGAVAFAIGLTWVYNFSETPMVGAQHASTAGNAID